VSRADYATFHLHQKSTNFDKRFVDLPIISSLFTFHYSETKPTQTGNYWHYVDGVPTEYYSDCTHLYTPEGTRLIGDRVLEVVCCAAEIEKPSAEVVYEAVKEIVGI
jgi:hypothetical protein